MCKLENDNVTLEGIELDKNLISQLTDILNTIHNADFNLNNLLLFIDRQKKFKNRYKYVMENFNLFAPNPPSYLPILDNKIDKKKNLISFDN
jgi:hypothetical protein